MNQTLFPPVLIGTPDLTPCELAAKQTSWRSKLKSFFKQAITYTVLASLQLGTLVQTKEAYAQYAPYGQPTNGQLSGQPNTGYVAPVAGAISGYTNDGTLFMGGQRIGNPHQILHDAQIPAFMTITATRYTFTNDPTHGQGTLAQMELATTNGSDANSVLLNRLYLSPTNPYVQGAPGPPNYQTYQGVLQNAQQANYLLTNADDGKTYAFKTLTASSRQAVDLLIRELPNTQQFRDNSDPLGGGVGVRVTQNGDAVALAAYLATVKPYDYSWQPNFGTTGGQNPAFSGWANSNNFAPDYSEGAGPAQSFQAFIKQLQDDAVANDKKVRSQTSANSLELSGVNPNSLFGEGYNLFEYGSNSNPNRDLENDFLRRLQAGQLTAGSADYLEASRIAQERYRIAYATRLETNKPLQYSVADAQRKANELKLGDINANELFGQGFDLFKYNPALRANGAAENDLLARLQSGQLQAGSSEYQQAAEIAQQRLRDAYAQSLSPPPPKKVAKWKLIAGAVVGAVLTFVTAGALLPYVAGALTSATVAATTAALATVSATVTTAAALATVGISASMTAVLTAVAGVVAGAVGAIASTSITTGNLSEGLKAGGKALVSGGVKAIVAGALGVGFATAGLSGLSGIEGTVSNIALNTLSGAVSSTILGEGSFADNLKTSAISSVVDVVAASAANTIGGAFPNPDGTNLANYAAHAVVGCASAAAKGGDCASGAIGAAAGEAAAATGFISWAAAGVGQTLNDNSTAFFGGLVGGTVAAAVGSTDKVESNFATGTATATNAVTNNYLNHNQIKEKEARLASVKDETDRQAIRDEYEQLDINQRDNAAACLLRGKCESVFDKENLKATLNELVASCVAPRICSADQRNGINELQEMYLTRQAIKPDTTIEEIALMFGKVPKALLTAAESVWARNTIAAQSELFAAARGGEVAISKTGIEWGKGIQGQGMPWENYLATELPASSRLPPNFKTFDFYDAATRTATSAKTLDTTTAAKLADPKSVYYSMKTDIDVAANYTTYTSPATKFQLPASQITTREVKYAIPANTTAEQWQQINRAVTYAQSQGIKLTVTSVK